MKYNSSTINVISYHRLVLSIIWRKCGCACVAVWLCVCVWVVCVCQQSSITIEPKPYKKCICWLLMWNFSDRLKNRQTAGMNENWLKFSRGQLLWKWKTRVGSIYSKLCQEVLRLIMWQNIRGHAKIEWENPRRDADKKTAMKQTERERDWKM